MKNLIIILITIFLMSSCSADTTEPKSKLNALPDTGQTLFFDSLRPISAPVEGFDFYGQDAQYGENRMSYTDNGNGTVTDNISGLIWTKTADLNGDGSIDYSDKLTYDEAVEYIKTVNAAGYTDWRLPTIKELYSLIDFNGTDPSGINLSEDDLVPFIDTDYFVIGYGDESAGERIIDSQFITSNIYVSTTMGGNRTMFGVNFVDGRIKGYPVDDIPGRKAAKKFYAYFVREESGYGVNEFTDNGNGTVTDSSTGLMWAQNDSGEGMVWKDALAYAEDSDYAGYSDWRLPNVKELQSIVDYTRSPATTNSAAIDPIFNCTKITDEGGNDNYAFYWSSTTHANYVNGSYGCYVAFGEALGFMEMPPMSGNYMLLDVHGAGAQRSDPKVGDPADYPYGHGPQGDVIRIYNMVRLVRDAE